MKNSRLVTCRALGFIAISLSTSACFDFDKAYDHFCDGGRCDVSQKDGAVSDAGDALDSGTTDAGSLFDAGTVDAGPQCLAWGTVCSGPSQCCARSDAGFSMECGSAGYCAEYADCREGGFACTGNEQCCSNNCVSGACSTLGRGIASNDFCSQGSECQSAWNCSSNVCTDDPAEGSGCNTHDACSSAWCDPSDAGVHSGICRTPPDGGCGVANSTDVANCCPGLMAGKSDAGSPELCCMPEGSWCWPWSGSRTTGCCSGNCLANRCVPPGKTKLENGDHCQEYNDSASGECRGTNSICDPSTSTCNTRMCLAPGLNPWVGCCEIRGNETLCFFPDAGTCYFWGPAASDARCCSGTRTDGFCDVPKAP